MGKTTRSNQERMHSKHPNTMNIFQTSYSQFSKVTQVRFHCSLSLSPLLITKPVILGVAAAAHCRSDREKDRHGEKVRSGGDKDDSLLGDFLPCGWRGGRHGAVADEFELELSLLLLLSLPFIVIARAEVLLLELAGLFDMPPLLPLSGELRFLSKRVL